MSAAVTVPVAAPSSRRAWLAPALLFLALALVPVVANVTGQGHWVSLMSRVMILAIAALSLDLILGVGGLVSFGHAAFVGLAAYSTGILIQEGIGDLFISLPVALVVCGLFGLFTGYVSLRTRGVAFIMITLAFGQMAFFLAQSLYVYGGDDGMTIPGRMTLAGLPLLKNNTAFYYFVFAWLAGLFVLVRAIVASRFGRALRGARDNATRMAALGYDVMKIRLAAYVMAGMMGGVAGLLLVNQTEFVSPAYMAWQRSGELIFIVIIGGLGSLWGAIAGAAAFLLLEEGLSNMTEHWKLIFGAMIVVFVLFTRGGLSALADRIFGGDAR